MASATHMRAPMQQRLWTPAFTTGVAIIALGGLVTVTRFVFGLGAVTNLSDGYPWGLWIAFDVVVGIALAAGGFVTAAILYVFNRGHYSPLVRPAVLTALLGYAMAAFGVFIDLGRWWQIYNPILPGNWQGNSALFEVSICVMSYLTVLAIEFMPTLTEKWKEGSNGLLKTISTRLDWLLNKVMILFILLGIVISTLHQSSLGSIMLLMPHRLDPLWFTPWLPLFFLMSAIGVGMHVAIFESILSSRSFGRKIEMPVLYRLARSSMVVLGLYVAARLADLTVYGELGLIFTGWRGVLLVLELAMFAGIPLIMLRSPRAKTDPKYLFSVSTMVMAGLLLNRFNVYLFGVKPHAGWSYFPTLWEVMVSAMAVSIIFVGYKVLANYFPVLHKEKVSLPTKPVAPLRKLEPEVAPEEEHSLSWSD